MKETHSSQGWLTEGRVSVAEKEEEESWQRKRNSEKGMNGFEEEKGRVRVTGAVRRVQNNAVPIPYTQSPLNDKFVG